MDHAHKVWINGELLPPERALISVFDAAVMLGDTVTESTRTFGQRPFRLDDHIDRLYKSLKVTRIDPGLSRAELREQTLGVLEANRHLLGPADDCWIVHNISRGRSVAGADPTRQQGPATVIIFTQPLVLTDWAPFYRGGCHAVTAMSRAVPPESLDAKIKNRSRMAYTLAEIEVKLVDPQAQGLLLDTQGNLAENKGGNVFLAAGGVLKTPTTRSALAGVSRATVLDLAAQIGVPAVECDLQPYDLYTADEAFFTSTPYCIMPATRFNGLPIGDGAVGPITRRLLAAWGDMVGLDIAAQAQAQLDRAA